MAMSEGSISVNPVTAAVTGSGAAKEVYDELASSLSFPPSMPLPAQAIAKEQLAAIARAIAKIVPHIQANAVVTVASGIAVSTTGTAAAQTGTTTTTGTGTIG